jgi:putative nucleotidyltransferase with HDIG domain
MKGKVQSVVKRLRREAAQPAWRRSKAIRWVIGVGLILSIAALFPHDRTTPLSGFSIGSLWTNEDISAPFSYPVYKDYSRYKQDVRRALSDLYPVYLPDTAARTGAIVQFHQTWQKLRTYLSSVTSDSVEGTTLPDSVAALATSKEDLALLTQASKHARFAHQLDEVEAPMGRTIVQLETRSVLVDEDEANVTGSSFISLRVQPQQEAVISKDSILTLDAASNRLYAVIDPMLQSEPAAVRQALSRVAFQSVKPNALYSAALTEESRRAIEERVPRTDGIVVEGQHIVDKGEIITPGIKASLESLAQARIDRGGIVAQFGRVAGTIGHAGVIVLLIVLYLKFIRRRIYNDNGQLLLLAVMLLFPAVLAFVSVRIQLAFPLEYLILLPVTSMLLTVLFDSRTGFYGTVVAALIIAGIRGNDYSVALAGLCAGAFAAYTVRDLRSRSQLFQSIAYIFIGYAIAIAALALEQATPLEHATMQLIAALANALISPVLTLGVLYVVESIFDTVSDLRLSEIDNINHPLLRELALRAPGTYQHTMLVAQLAENAAIAIGANPLLAKVGAYFHDVGKLTDPTDFVENQGEGGNVHTDLSPYESARRVKNHVEQGIELARAHDLPERIVDFIPMHHGTLPISFFYQRALSDAADGESVDEGAFRYPGPRPNTKETAIVMLADAAEAIARTLSRSREEMTQESIESSVESLVRSRFDQGQLDQSDITVKDLTVIRSVFGRLLTGLHHPRIAYPSRPSEQEQNSRVAIA